MWNEAQLLIKVLIGDYEGMLCAQSVAAAQSFQNHRFSKTHSPMLGDGADRLHIGIVRPHIIPAGAVGSKFTLFIHYRKAQFAFAVGRQNFICQHFPQLRRITLMSKAFLNYRLISQIILREADLPNGKLSRKFVVQQLI